MNLQDEKVFKMCPFAGVVQPDIAHLGEVKNDTTTWLFTLNITHSENCFICVTTLASALGQRLYV